MATYVQHLRWPFMNTMLQLVLGHLELLELETIRELDIQDILTAVLLPKC